MIPVFKYTFQKAFIKPSTFVFVGIAVLLLGLGPLLADVSQYSTTEELINAQFPSINFNNWMFVGTIIFSFFISSKATSFVSDELEDGTLLSVISKPVSRLEIIIGKYLAIIATCLVFIFVLTFTPSSFLAIKANNPQIISMVVPVAMKQTLFFTLFMTILLAIILPLSLKMGSKILITVGILFSVIIAVGAIVIPIVMGTSSFGASGAGIGEVYSEEQMEATLETSKVSTMSVISWVNIPQHFQTMYEYASKEMFTGDLMESMIIAPKKPVFKEVEVEGVTMYELVEYKDYINPLALYAFYTSLTIGLSALTVRKFSKNDFM